MTCRRLSSAPLTQKVTQSHKTAGQKVARPATRPKPQPGHPSRSSGSPSDAQRSPPVPRISGRSPELLDPPGNPPRDPAAAPRYNYPGGWLPPVSLGERPRGRLRADRSGSLGCGDARLPLTLGVSLGWTPLTAGTAPARVRSGVCALALLVFREASHESAVHPGPSSRAGRCLECPGHRRCPNLVAPSANLSPPSGSRSTRGRRHE